MTKDIDWGFNGLGNIVYRRTYSRDDETWPDTIERIIKACRTQLKVGFEPEEEEFLRSMMTDLKGTVAGRFLWQLGTKTVKTLGLASLQNCAAVVVDEPVRPFTWTMDMLMLGSGVGYNIQKEHVYEIPKVRRAKITRTDTNDADFIVPDSREGWVKLLEYTLRAHFNTRPGDNKDFTYSTICIRSKGAPIKGFGGVASGPEELCWGIERISEVLNARAGKKLRPIDALDIMNIIGYIVVAGNVRRSAQIAIGDADDKQFLNAKRWDLGGIPNWRAMSNNSVVCNDIRYLDADFWNGYEGNGEPYGLINLRNARRMGRAGEEQYPDKNVMIFNPCVTGDTKLITKNGQKRIEDLVDSPVEIWNGFEWSEVTPKITGEDQEILGIKFSDGRSLKCTPYHKFHLSRGYRGEQEVVEAKDLKIGDKLIKCSYPVVEGGIEGNPDDLYTQGFYSADGVRDRNLIWLYDPKYSLESYLNVRQLGKEYTNDVGVSRKAFRMNFDPFGDKSWIPTEYDVNGRLSWLAGLLDGDAVELNEGGCQLGSVDREFLGNVQSLLTTLGVNSKILLMNEEGPRMMPDQKGGYKEYQCQTSYRLCVTAQEMQDLKSLGLSCKRLKFDKTPNRNASRFTTVVGMEEMGREDLVYCFNEPKRHLGVFDGVVTGQCAEQSLENYETCCLAEMFLPRISSYEEFIRVAKTLYRINKHSLAMKCHHKETESIVNNNMRMGIGVTGYLMASDEQKGWLNKAYGELRQYDEIYSDEHGFPRSIKLTTVKPSGTLSLLAGVSAGAHPGYSRYHIRRVRIASSSSLVGPLRDAGYPCEYARGFDGSEQRDTTVVSFPCEFPEGTTFEEEVSAVDQLETVKELQTNWSDNAVSVTVYYSKEELPEIKKWLEENYNVSVKSLSFLLRSDHGFDQAPLEKIDKAKYDEMIKGIKPLELDESAKLEDIDLDNCEGGVCPVR